ncbi:hypothetical protein CPB83DRAFT_861080 [Crepidotus variabilis]|uniref:Uncharacterized protein n=1 Tax=Crepidotus variabilis TaxID=179855 RepID=A0A9P6E8Q2_9AGAR|nr:hypothetical protein CPB83DRAFT_861080 [Crepidotus variabilis]
MGNVAALEPEISLLSQNGDSAPSQPQRVNAATPVPQRPLLGRLNKEQERAHTIVERNAISALSLVLKKRQTIGSTEDDDSGAWRYWKIHIDPRYCRNI